jgi:heme/copper-type cytochrome/quinol oxidase subunit 2
MFIFLNLDIARISQLFFQDTATPTMTGIIDLHQHVFFFIIFIFCIVGFQIFDVLSFFRIDNFYINIFPNKKNIIKKNFIFDILSFLEKYTVEKYKSIFFNKEDDFFAQQVIYEFYGRYLYFYVLDRFFENENNFLTSFLRVKSYFKFLKFDFYNFSNFSSINKHLQLINNLPLISKNKQIRKNLIKIILINLFKTNIFFKKSNYPISYIFSVYYGGFSLFKNFENILKKNLIHLSLFSKIYKFNHNTFIETIWTLIPILIVLAIAIPSFVLMYALDAALDGVITIKAIGHQWYWSYECEFPDVLNYLNDINNINFENLSMINIHFDSYMIYTDQLKKGEIRLLEADKALFIPYRVPVDIVITSIDVIHSWAVPSLGVKVDAVPGRLNHIGIFIERKGVFYGQCSELCGGNHGFMPIKVVAVSYADYINYCYTLFASSIENVDNLIKLSKFF